MGTLLNILHAFYSSLSCPSRRRLTLIALHRPTAVDAQCDKLVTVVGQRKPDNICERQRAVAIFV